MKNAYSLFLRVPLFTFQPPEGPFLLLSRRHRCSRCLTGPREAASGRRNQWGVLGGVGMLLSSPQLLASASLLSNAIPERPTVTHRSTQTHTRGGILASIKGPRGSEKRALSHWRHWGWLAFLSRGMYSKYAHTHTHTRASSNRHHLVRSQRYKACQHMYTHGRTHNLQWHTHTHGEQCVCDPSELQPPSLPGGVVWQTGGWRDSPAERRGSRTPSENEW